MEKVIDINGDKFVKRKQNVETPSVRKMKTIAIMAGLTNVFTANVKSSNVKNSTMHLNVVEEYRLIDAFKKGIVSEKSKLSKRERDLIIYEFNKHFIPQKI